MENNKLDEIMNQLEEGVSNLFTSDKYRQYLDTMSQFHNYSINNCILIAMQKPDATQVAGYNVWKNKFNRQVLKGEKGITIIAPSPYKTKRSVEIKDANGNPILDVLGKPITEEKEVTIQAFKPCKVFDVSQTDGEPLPEIVSDLTNPVNDYDRYLQAIKDVSPVPVRFDEIKSGAKGFYSHTNSEIVIQRGLPEEQTIKTMIHEVAHAKLGHGGKDDVLSRNTREVQAESVAYASCKALGLNTEDYSFGYIAGWSSGKDMKELKENLQIIKDQTNQIVSGIKEKLSLSVVMQPAKIGIDGKGIKFKM